ncbi:hypothetical protein ACLOJK_017526 [Asimina triloba]
MIAGGWGLDLDRDRPSAVHRSSPAPPRCITPPVWTLLATVATARTLLIATQIDRTSPSRSAAADGVCRWCCRRGGNLPNAAAGSPRSALRWPPVAPSWKSPPVLAVREDDAAAWIAGSALRWPPVEMGFRGSHGCP